MSQLRITLRDRQYLIVIAAIGNPGQRDICRALGIASTNAVSEKLVSLERKGLIFRGRKAAAAICNARDMQLTTLGWSTIGVRPCPHCGAFKAPKLPGSGDGRALAAGNDGR